METEYDLIAIGGGTAGLTVTRLLAKTGWRVAIVERDRLGGDCLFTGCVPTKALIEAASILHAARSSERLGLALAGEVDFQAVKARVAEAQRLAGEVDTVDALRREGVDVIQGEGRFESRGAINVDGRRLRSRHFAICSGSEAIVPPIDGLADVAFDTNVEAVAWDHVPRSLTVLGGGAIGAEFAQLTTRLGSHVEVIEAADRLLSGEEPEASRLVEERFRAEGIAVHTGSRLVRVRQGPESQLVLTAEAGVGPFEMSSERLLVAVGRRARVEGLGLEEAGVKYGPSGVDVDGQLRTSNELVFAIGDVTGDPMFTHVAEDQARFVANLLKSRSPSRKRSRWTDRVVPRVTFTDPEVASVGLTVAEARTRYKGARRWRIPLSDVDRAITMERTEGYLQIVTAPGWPGRIPGLVSRIGPEIVGASLVAPNAGELLAPIVMAMRARLPAGLVAWNMQAYPTLVLGVRQVAGLPFE